MGTPQMPQMPQSPRQQDPRDVENKKRFDDVLGGDFTRIHEGIKFPIDVPGVIDVTVTSPESKTQGHVNVFYRDRNGKERGTTLTISASGDLIGKIPKELGGIDHADLYTKVLNGLKPFTSSFWIETDMSVIPPGNWPSGAKVGGGGPSRGPVGIDPERLTFLQHQPDALFGHITQKDGFKDYRLVFFPNYIILEHPAEENAAYFIDLPEGDTIVMPEYPKRSDIEAIVTKYWKPNLQVTKKEMIDSGNTRIPHQGDWMTRMQEEIQKRPTYKKGPNWRP
jgi:hypothetical protein